jgi:hypothetical protein
VRLSPNSNSNCVTCDQFDEEVAHTTAGCHCLATEGKMCTQLHFNVRKMSERGKGEKVLANIPLS